MTIIMVTGHRPTKLGGYNLNTAKNVAIKNAVIKILTQIKSEHNDVQVVTGMALGFDQIVAICCNELSIPFIAQIPFPGQESRWPDQSQKEYLELLKTASTKLYTTKEIPQNNREASQILMKRNSDMINIDGVIGVISCWDGSKSGTSDAITKTKRKGLWRCNIDPSTVESGFSIVWEDDPRRNHHTNKKLDR